MKREGSSVAGSKIGFIAGWVLSVLVIAFVGVLPVALMIGNPKMMSDGAKELGYPESAAHVIVWLEIGCALVYAVPSTAALGAILLTGYLGGAVATHVHEGQNHQWFMAVIVAVVAWLGLFLRDKRVRALLPLR